MNPVNLPRSQRITFSFPAIGPLVFLAGCSQKPVTPDGHWEGNITWATNQLGVRVDIEQAGGAWSGTIDIPTQGVRELKLIAVTVDGSTVRFSLPDIPGDPTFAGQLDTLGQTIDGDFTQGGQKYSLKLERKTRSTAVVAEAPVKGVPGHGIAGYWQGSLKPASYIELRLVLEISDGGDGRFQGIMISLDQSNTDVPISALTEKSGVVQLKLDTISGAYDGTLNTDGSEIAGIWHQRGRDYSLVFMRLERSPTLVRPQEPSKPYPYTEEEVTVENQVADVKLAGTLTLPRGNGPHPAVVLITGSGPQDRDEAVLGHRPFLVLADHLTRAGIAVLRCDDRGVGKSTGNFEAAVFTDFIEDALAEAAWLKTRKEIDPRRIGLIGHSEGGMVAPHAAAQQPDEIAFIVLLAGVGVPFDELAVRQGTDIARAMGASEETIAKNVDAQRQLYPLLKQAPDNAVAEQLAREMAAKQLAELTEEERRALNMTDEMIESNIKVAAMPWFRQMLAFDPRPALRQVKCPVLALNGDKDVQVAAKENLGAIQDALAAGGNQHVKIVELPGLNHFFQTCTTGAISEYSQIEETFSPAALKVVSDWIREQTGLGP